ncbi:hypothetical protein GCM10010466_07140 [Planomonospora alba]|uniref:Uncharacterized protein n=1 Tax=Planomonospora alba TaxID=161354 RepID=A0ABP6MLR5_9ACTN
MLQQLPALGHQPQPEPAQEQIDVGLHPRLPEGAHPAALRPAGDSERGPPRLRRSSRPVDLRPVMKVGETGRRGLSGIGSCSTVLPGRGCGVAVPAFIARSFRFVRQVLEANRSRGAPNMGFPLPRWSK